MKRESRHYWFRYRAQHLFYKIFKRENAGDGFSGYKDIAAYPCGSRDIKSSAEQIPEYTAKAQRLNVEMMDSIEKLLEKDAVFL
ncbi:MAG: hypothetical protein ABI416_10155 [Ginsengibacter sp.]